MSPPNLEECLKLLKGERDEKRLAWLLLVTKFCKPEDWSSLSRLYDALGPRFLYCLLRTGMETGGGALNDNRNAYLSISITVLAAFCRLPKIRSSVDMLFNIPLFLEVISTRSALSVPEECYELLLLVSTASESGIARFFDSGGIKILAAQMRSLQDGKILFASASNACLRAPYWSETLGSHLMELSFKLLQLIMSISSLDIIQNNDISEISVIVTAIARQFAVLHNSLKFEALHLLNVILSS